ncbi:GNAT family N-acetyltransferase [Nonomuraea typhae]|uniref:GNAT family N-acetyltransferase n=1 Tax=Nonomuraea typhae TaxID=2603600 RepID=UPI0012F77C73|nr:GNAT family N-acetyltransferase [Nonomuraea typhae]
MTEGLVQIAAEIEEFLAGQPLSRVTLRPLTRHDETEFTALVRASADLHHPWMSLPDTEEGFRAYLARFDLVTARPLLVCVRETGDITGMININSIIRGRFQNGSLGYAAFAPSAGRGYMTEGLGLVLRYAFGQLRLHRLEAQIQPGNTASIKLVRRLGFRFEGLSPALLFINGAWEDHERWAIHNPQPWPAHPSLPNP